MPMDIYATPAAAEVLADLGSPADLHEIAERLAFMEVDGKQVLCTPDEAVDAGQFDVLKARRRLLDFLEQDEEN